MARTRNRADLPSDLRRRPWMKFYAADWRANVELRRCGLLARGLWVDMLTLMHDATPYGHLVDDTGGPMPPLVLAHVIAAPVADVEAALAELERRGVFSRTGSRVIYSRRMVKDARRAAINQANGLDGGNPNLRRGKVPKELRVRPYRRQDSPAKTQRILDRSGGRCHWCQVQLVVRWDGNGVLPSNFFHIDHVIPVCDGGTNDEDNLVAACRVCNHERAKVGWVPPTDTKASVNVGTDNGEAVGAVGIAVGTQAALNRSTVGNKNKISTDTMASDSTDANPQMPDARKEEGKKERESPPTAVTVTPNSTAAVEDHGSVTEAIVSGFLALRERHWPSSPAMAAPLATLRTQAAIWASWGATPELALSVMDAVMRQNVLKGDPNPPTHLRFCERSLEPKALALARDSGYDQPRAHPDAPQKGEGGEPDLWTEAGHLLVTLTRIGTAEARQLGDDLDRALVGADLSAAQAEVARVRSFLQATGRT